LTSKNRKVLDLIVGAPLEARLVQCEIEARLRKTEVALQGALQQLVSYGAICAAITSAAHRVPGLGASPVLALATSPGAIVPLNA